MIQIEHLVKRYGQTLAVDDVCAEIPAGKIVGFLGPNGAGKSTTMRIVTGFMPATSGRVLVGGRDVFGESLAVRGQIGYLPENTPLYPEMRVEEYLDYRGRLYKMGRVDRRRRIGEVCERCGLSGSRRRLVGQLSRGNRQRVGLAQALLHDPPVLILDEPTAGLDPNQITHVRELIAELRGKHTVLLSSHILPEVERSADHVLVIARGKIVAEGSPDELRRRVSSGSRVLLEVRAGADAVRGGLAGVPGVGGVEVTSEGGWSRAVVSGAGGGDVRGALGEVVASEGWVVREMRYETASLEEFFIQITAQQDAGSAAA